MYSPISFNMVATNVPKMFLPYVQWVYCGNMLLVLRTLKVHGKRVNYMLGTLEHYFCTSVGNILETF